MTTLASPSSSTADAMVNCDVREVVAREELGGDLGHDLLGHLGVRLVLEALDLAAAGTPAHGPGERRDRARLLRRDLRDRGVERQRRLADAERAARDRRDERDLVPVREFSVGRRVAAVDGVEESLRLVTEGELWPRRRRRAPLRVVRLPVQRIRRARGVRRRASR